MKTEDLLAIDIHTHAEVAAVAAGVALTRWTTQSPPMKARQATQLLLRFLRGT